MDLYAGKVAVVTGTTRGIGRMIVEHFLRQGATVVGLARSEQTIQHLNYSHFRVDISVANEVRRVFLEISRQLPSVHIAVNNAGILTSQHSMIMPGERAAAMVETNLLGTFYVSREAAKLMRKSKYGRIINISSMAARLEPIGDSIYAACKAGVITLANVMAKEFSGFNVTCNTLGVSAMETDMLQQLPRQKIDAIIRDLPAPRYATVDDVCNVIDFFASERSSYITAQTLFLGGVH